MLNAWRRHWNGHGDRADVWRRHWNGHKTAPPPAASLERAPEQHHRPRRLASVLNAWRRHWNGHPIDDNQRSVLVACSTPGGVIGTGTRSSVFSSGSANPCSTPGGVIGTGTRNPRQVARAAEVLNAWRRHWNGHNTDPDKLKQYVGAQRLAASLERARCNLMATFSVNICAQRLAASLERARRSPGPTA